ncbi:MAG: hypothetical protein COB50_03760 [Thiotrichales bacterium]|nr:MAG: hypothetical protein COB50_03760 [Thiotrichales bacterium]
MFRYHKVAPVVLIDEYDMPIQEAYLRGYYSEMVDFMRGMLSSALKDNDYLHKAILTGILRVAQESIFSGLNNVEVYSILRRKYSNYFGFTEDEVSILLDHVGCDNRTAIKSWYNGYKMGGYVVYNPWSIISCLKQNCKLQPYWVNTSSNDLIKKLLISAPSKVKEGFEKLLQGGSVVHPINENLKFPDLHIKQEALWNLLLFTGYLTVGKKLDGEEYGFKEYFELVIPNNEILSIHQEILTDWFVDAIDSNTHREWVYSLLHGDLEKFQAVLQEYIMTTGSYFDFSKNTPEKIYHVFILGLIVGLTDKFHIESNREAGGGRADVILLPKQKSQAGFVIEFKTAQTESDLENAAKNAITQIKEKNYLARFDKNITNKVYLVGIAFCGKKLCLRHEIKTVE